MDYEVIGRIGRGGTGVVDLARTPDGNPVAVKRLSLHGSPDELSSARRRITREAEVLQHLDHPALVRLLDTFDDGDDLVLVMAYLSGGNLTQRVQAEGLLPAGEVDAMARRLLEGLAYAHRRGVVHRDIKPANVLFDDEGRAALGDFGAAFHRDATPGLTATQMVVGTPGFMAPEQARGEPATAASDVFSLAATLAFALTGHGPWGTGAPDVLLLRAAAGQISPLPRSIPSDLRLRLEAMLAADPVDRPTAAAARGGTDGTRPISLASPRTKRPAIGRARAGGIALLALAGIAGAAVVVGAGIDRQGGGPTKRSAPFTPCHDTRYRRCGEAPAPNTDGRRCLGGTADYDRRAANGCEAEPDDNRDPRPLAERATGTIVPADDIDHFTIEVSDHAHLNCDGQLVIELKPAPGAIQRLTVRDEDGDQLDTDLASGRRSARIELREPNCGSDDSTTLTATVRAETGSKPSAGRYVLTRSGSY